MNIKIEVDTVVKRMLAGEVPMDLIVTEITDNKIICGAWEFDKHTGNEIDDFFDGIISYIIL